MFDWDNDNISKSRITLSYIYIYTYICISVPLKIQVYKKYQILKNPYSFRYKLRPDENFWFEKEDMRVRMVVILM